MIPVLDATGTSGKSVLEGGELQAALAGVVSAITAASATTQPVSNATGATSALQTTGNTSLAALVTAVANLATSAGQSAAATTLSAIATSNAAIQTAVTDTTTPAPIQGVANGVPVDTVVKATATDIGASVGTTAVTLTASNASRRGFSVQNQHATAKIYISGSTTATADFHSLMIGPGQYYETPANHTGTGAISCISDTASTPVYARAW